MALIRRRAAGRGAGNLHRPTSLRDLPAGGNLFALIEAAQPEITTDRFNSGGLNAGDAGQGRRVPGIVEPDAIPHR